ncbi:NAD(P)-binding protein [Gyrodon lividus]|nr:NAD(P)-binding protein [Gyrodon lividus]
MSISRTWLVTGASRGIGFSIVQQLLRSPDNIVFAACRNPASAVVLNALEHAPETLGKVYIIQMDVTDEASISCAKDEVGSILDGGGVDYLINNAGIAAKNDTPATLAPKDLASTIISNVAGPALVTRAFIPFIEKGNRKVIANISSAMASIGMDYGGEHSSYSISKAALNMLTYKQAKERPDLIAFLVDPGWVKTDMGGTHATLEPHESAAGIIQVISSATASDVGRFIDYKGETVPW